MDSQYIQDVAECEEHLRQLLLDEYMQNVKDDLENQPRDLPIPKGITTWKAPSGPDIGIQVEVAIEEYNTAVCRQVVFDRVIKLPRELRDLVWEYLVPKQVELCTKRTCTGVRYTQGTPHMHDESTVCFRRVRRSSSTTSDDDDESRDYDEIMDDDDSSDDNDDSDSDHDESTHDRWMITNSWSDRSWTPSTPRTHEDCICPGYYWRDDIIGSQCSRELMECFYRTSTFSIASCIDLRKVVDKAGALESFLNNDHFACGLLPKAWITNLVLKIQIPEYTWKFSTSGKGLRYRLSESGGWREQDKQVRNSVEGLRCLKKKVRIVIQLDRPAGSERRWNDVSVKLETMTVDRLMMLMTPMLALSRGAGHGVTVELTKKWKDEGVRLVLDKWLNRLEHGQSEDNDS